MLNIAVVDDDKPFLSMYSKFISESFSKKIFSANINVYASGTDLIDSLAVKEFDIVFMDIDMPGISGIDLAAELRKNNKNVSIIFVSAQPHFVFATIRFTPYRFIRKNNLKVETLEVVDSYCSEIQDIHKMILLELQNGDVLSEKADKISDFFAVRHDVYCTLENENNAVILESSALLVDKNLI